MSNLLIVFIFLTASLGAKDLGKFGETFPIQEDDLIEVLQDRLVQNKMDAKKKQEFEQTFVNSIKNPKGSCLPKAIQKRCFEFDPTIYVREDVKDQNGNIIIPKGTKINPLDSNPLKEDLLFFDGKDPDQLRWAKIEKGKWILTTGSPLEIEEKENRPVYFDQFSYLQKKLNIQYLPAKVTQSGNKLKIEEVPCF